MFKPASSLRAIAALAAALSIAPQVPVAHRLEVSRPARRNSSFGADPHYTKRGPGRRPIRRRKRGSQRLAPAMYGGNYQGVEYLSYREHDMVNRLMREHQLTRAEALVAVKEARPRGYRS